VNVPFHTVHIDISGKNYQKEYIIVQIDAFSKFVHLFHITRLGSENCIKSMRSLEPIFGLSFYLIGDQGRSFASTAIRDIRSTQNIHLHLIATDTSRTNGQVERVMSTLKIY